MKAVAIKEPVKKVAAKKPAAKKKVAAKKVVKKPTTKKVVKKVAVPASPNLDKLIVELKQLEVKAEVVEVVKIVPEAVEPIKEVEVKVEKKLRTNAKIVEQIDLETGKVITTWESVRLAGEGISKGSGGIRNCCRGVNKTAHGFKWSYQITKK